MARESTRTQSLAEYQQGVEARKKDPLRVMMVALVGKASAALEIQGDASGLSETDVINNALQGYGFIAAAQRLGYELRLHDPSDRSQQRVVMFPAGSVELEALTTPQ